MGGKGGMHRNRGQHVTGSVREILLGLDVALHLGLSLCSQGCSQEIEWI